MNDALIQTFALTFGFPYTQTRQELRRWKAGGICIWARWTGFTAIWTARGTVRTRLPIIG